MTLVNVRNLGIAFSNPLFSGLNIAVNAGDRIGLVAANGRGKSTFLRCIAGTLDPTEGEITTSRGLTIGCVQQDPPQTLLTLTLYEAVLAALPPEQAKTESWRVDVMLDSIQAPEALRKRELGALSGGWQRLALLARAWVTEPDLLLMDEPTNHLDLGKITLLEAWLNALPSAQPFVLASHDRAFLDAVTNRTLFLRPERCRVFSLPYTRARAALDEADAAEAGRYEKDIRIAEQLRRQAAKLNNIGINSGSDLLVVKTKQLKERAQRLEASAKPAHKERPAGVIRLANRGTHAKVLVTLDDVEVHAPDGALLFRTGKQFIRQGDRIALLGANGAGKTRLIIMVHAAVNGQAAAQAGIKVTASLVMGYSDQALATLGDADTALETVVRRFDVGEQRARALLAGAGVAFDMQTRRVGQLSGGQKARLNALVLRLTNPNFYLLDEPTNHLDIEGQEALESELVARQATCLLVSHDRSFIRAVGTRFWQIERKRLLEVDSPEPFFGSRAA